MAHTTIWKFACPLDDRVVIPMPEGAYVLHVDSQRGEICIWALVRPEARTVRRVFHVRGTGHPTDGLTPILYLGTVHMGPFVWHVFDGGTETSS